MGGGGNAAQAGDEKLAFADITWFDAYKKHGERGRFRYLVVNADGSLHREIVAEVDPDDADTGVVIDGATARFVGVVTYDSKTSAGGHDEGGGASGGETGCDDTTGEAGCSGGAEGGTAGGGSHDEEEGGCSGGHEDEGSGGPKHPPGSASREGQMVAVEVVDNATPGRKGDEVTWSWFANPYDPADPYLPPPSIGDLASWPELCNKPVLGGNLVVHHKD